MPCFVLARSLPMRNVVFREGLIPRNRLFTGESSLLVSPLRAASKLAACGYDSAQRRSLSCYSLGKQRNLVGADDQWRDFLALSWNERGEFARDWGKVQVCSEWHLLKRT